MIKKILAGLSIIAIVIAVVFLTIVTQVYRFWVQGASDDDVVIEFTIDQGSSFSEIADDLEAHGLIASDFWFGVYAKLDGSAKLIRAGVYNLNPGINYANLIDTLTEYSQGQDVSITIPEGYTIKQIGELVTENFNVMQEDWDYWTGINSPLESNEFIKYAQKPDSVDLEGYLFPDTYRFFPDATAEIIVRELVGQLQENIESVDGVDDLENIESVHELLTLASIVEKEVPSANEMKIVSGIFQNRLEIDMALQACSTINYVTGKDDPAASAEDLEIDSPYNTYIYSGLTPGPISNPGLNAIDSVVNPTNTNYFYFLATPQGETIYAKTFEEHVANKVRYLY